MIRKSVATVSAQCLGCGTLLVDGVLDCRSRGAGGQTRAVLARRGDHPGPVLGVHRRRPLRREQERIFGGPSWSYVALAAEIPGPGDFVRTSVGETPVIVTRGRDGTVHVLVNRCAHRGVMFCHAPSGNRYHVHVPVPPVVVRVRRPPARRAVQEGRRWPRRHARRTSPTASTASRRCAVAERHGVVFASFSDDVPPLRGLPRGDEPRLVRPRLRRTAAARARLPAPGHPGQLEADVREHQGPLPRQPAARLPRDVRPVPGRQPVEDADGRDRPALGARVATLGPARGRRHRPTSPGYSTTSSSGMPACSNRSRSSPARPPS